MADFFTFEDARELLFNKKILFLGDSILRSIYQDLLSLLEDGNFSGEDGLKLKGEELPSYMGDLLVVNTGKLTTGRDYDEIRLYINHQIEITFLFTTRIYRDTVEKYLDDLNENCQPDIILVLSCLWDLSRWGPSGPEDYEGKCNQFLQRISKDVHLIWLLCPPISPVITGAIMVEELVSLQEEFRFLVLEGNRAAAATVVRYGFDVLDLHYHMMPHLHMRMEDGVHWTSPAIRIQTNLVLSHIALGERATVPQHWAGCGNSALDKQISCAEETVTRPEIVEEEDSEADPLS